MLKICECTQSDINEKFKVSTASEIGQKAPLFTKTANQFIVDKSTMPPKRTPTKVITPKSKKDKTPRVVMPEVRVRDSSVESTASVTAPSMPAGISPEFLAYIQMQDRIRAEEKQEANRLRAEEKQEAAELRAKYLHT